MPVLPAAPGVTRAVMQYKYDGQVCNNVMHFGAVPFGISPSPTELAARLYAWYQANIKIVQPTSCILEAINTTELDAIGAPGHVFIPPSVQAGTGGTLQLPNNVTVAMSLRTALRGRSYRGRIYHIGLDEARINGNVVAPTTLTQLINGYTALLTMPPDTGEPAFDLGVLSYYANDAIRSSPVFTPVVQVTSDGVVDSMRRRLPGRGR